MLKVLDIDDYDLPEAIAAVTNFGASRYGYIVTPNVDHVIRHYHDVQFRSLYSRAALVLLDSRLLAGLFALFKRQRLRVCLGSDLTAALFESVIKADDRVVLVGASPDQANELRRRYGLMALQHIDPPMNFVQDPVAVDKCLLQIEAKSPFRFCFLAVGSPQQELIAFKLWERGHAQGLSLCVGASINFITGKERRAPIWLRTLALEWFYRLLQNPRRMARRYLIRDPQIFFLLSRIQVRLRRPALPPPLRAVSTSLPPEAVELTSTLKAASSPAGPAAPAMVAGRAQSL